MTQACILNSIHDVKDCLNNNRHKHSLLFTTHPSVEILLNEKYGIRCELLSRYLQTEEIRRWLDEICSKVDRLLEEYDETIGSRINKAYGFNINYFKPLYSYLGKHQYLGYQCFIEAIERAEKKNKIDRFTFYNCPVDYYFENGVDLKKFTEEILSTNARIEFVEDKNSHREIWTNRISKLKRVCSNPKTYLKKMISLLKERGGKQKLDIKKPTLLIYHGLYNLAFLRDELKRDYNIIEYRNDGKLNHPFRNNDMLGDMIVLESFKNMEVSSQLLDKFFLKNILVDFNKHISGYLKSLMTLKKIHSQSPITLGIWGNPPIHNLKSLVFEFLMQNKINVVGAQHGAVYGDQKFIWHVDSDFTRCNEYLSYGFTQNDLERIYKEYPITIKVHAVGMVGKITKNAKRKKIDVLFPITNSMGIFNAGMSRALPHDLNDKQLKILEYLNTLKSKKIYVKPFSNSSNSNLAMLPVFKRLENLKIVTKYNLNEFMKKYEPAIIIIEFPSTPLYEAMFTSAEIFILNDNVLPYDDEALKFLKKRVHYFENIEEMISGIEEFLGAENKKRNNNEFFHRYVHKSDSKERARLVLNDIIKQELGKHSLN